MGVWAELGRLLDPRADELDALVLEGHGGALNPEAGDGTEDFERRHAALQDRLKCDVITVAEEVAKEKACRVSPQFAQCLAELTMTYALGLADDVPDAYFHLGGDEVAIAELADGTLILNARGHNNAPRSRKVARSSDGGKTWTPLANDPALPSPHCMASILSFDRTIDGVRRTGLLYAGPWSTDGRVAGSIAVSLDGAKTWSKPIEVVSGPFAYSQLSMIGDGEVGLLYEGDRYARIALLRRSLDGLIGQAVTDAPTTSTAP